MRRAATVENGAFAAMAVTALVWFLSRPFLLQS